MPEPQDSNIVPSDQSHLELEAGELSPEVKRGALQAIQPSPDVEVVATWCELRGAWRVFEMSEWIMRDRVGFFNEVRQSHDLESKLRSMVLSTVIYIALYGLVMGICSGWQQALASAVKLPMLFLVTLLISLPTLYFFNLLYGSQLTFAQTTALIMAALTITGALSLAFASITLFFLLTVREQYTILVLLNIGVLATSSWWGLSFLRQGMRYVQGGTQARQGRILAIWLLIYGLVGTQMGWALRPFFKAPWEAFVILRGGGGTFYGSMLTAIGWLIPKLLAKLFG
jgi:hypothetical protein